MSQSQFPIDTLAAEEVMVALILPDTPSNRELDGASVVSLPDLLPESEAVVLVEFGEFRIAQNVVRKYAEKAGIKEEVKRWGRKGITQVRMRIRANSGVKSMLEYTFAMDRESHFMDVEDVEPECVVRVHVTRYNAQPRKSEEEWQPKPFIDRHQYIAAVGDNLDLLKTVFPSHARGGYFETLSGIWEAKGLHILVAPYNSDAALAGNLFVDRPGLPPDHALLGKALRRCTWIITLRKGIQVNMSRRVETVYRNFREELDGDPLRKFFNEYGHHIQNRNIAEKKNRPHFKAAPRAFFESWYEYERIIGIGMILEQRFHSRDYEYQGLAKVIPLRNTYSKSSQLHMGYTVFFSPEQTDEPQPSLTAKTRVQVSFTRPVDTFLDVWWEGKVTSSTVGAEQDEITIVIQRPSQNIPWTHSEEVSTLRRDDGRRGGRETSLDEGERRRQIKVSLGGNPSEIERLTSNFSEMAQERLPGEFNGVESKWKDTYQALLLGKEYDTLVRSGLYEDVKNSDTAIEFLRETLRPYQMEWVQKLVSNGLVARLAALTGPSGSGKSTAMFAAVLPYMLPIRYDADEYNASVHLARILRTEFDERASKKDDVQFAKEEQLGQEYVAPSAEPISPEEDSPPPDVTEPQWVEGRVTIVAMQNESVENAYESYTEWAERFAASTGHAPFLGFRMYSLETEISAVLAMIHPGFDASLLPSLPYFMVDPDMFADDVTKKHSENFLKAMSGSEYEGIRDRRFQNLHASMAYGVLQLAGIAPLSAAMKAAFTKEDLDQAYKALIHLRDARSDISKSKLRTISVEMKRPAVYAARKALLFLLSRASYIVTSLGVATQSSFIRSTTALACEEAGRVNDPEFLGLLSHFVFAKVHVVNGSPNQLPPMAFGPPSENPFHEQLQISTLTRLVETGFPVYELLFTARFRNEELLAICNFVNRKTYAATEGSFSSSKTAKAKKVMAIIWGVDSPVVYLDLPSPDVKYTPTKSAYNTDSAATALHTILSLIRAGISAHDVTYLTPYNAQLDVFTRLLSTAIEARCRRAAYNLKLKDTLQATPHAVTKCTVDSYMGKNNEYIVLDTCGLQRGFLYDERRFLVALTRARTAMVLVGHMERPEIGSRKIFKPDHPLYEVSRFVLKIGGRKGLGREDVQRVRKDVDVVE